MKKSLLLILFIIFVFNLNAQHVTTDIGITQNNVSDDAPEITVSIYPVPVKENRFTIKTNRDVSLIRITNIIGQDIFRIQYKNPQKLNNILLDNPKRGMYIVTIIFSDGTRVVKKIMVEESD